MDSWTVCGKTLQPGEKLSTVLTVPMGGLEHIAVLNNDNAPVNHFGKPLSRSITYYTAIYNGAKGLYTAADVERYHMSNPQKFEL